MVEILWPRRETRRRTEKTNLRLNSRDPIYSPLCYDIYKFAVIRDDFAEGVMPIHLRCKYQIHQFLAGTITAAAVGIDLTCRDTIQ